MEKLYWTTFLEKLYRNKWLQFLKINLYLWVYLVWISDILLRTQNWVWPLDAWHAVIWNVSWQNAVWWRLCTKFIQKNTSVEGKPYKFFTEFLYIVNHWNFGIINESFSPGTPQNYQATKKTLLQNFYEKTQMTAQI